MEKKLTYFKVFKEYFQFYIPGKATTPRDFSKNLSSESNVG